MSKHTYVCIDLKSFYASVECRERGLNPMTTNLVVADLERSEKTICLAVSPAMKALGVPGRCRIFEIPKQIEYIVAPPRMQLYIDYAAEIYAIYLKYIAKAIFNDIPIFTGIYDSFNKVYEDEYSQSMEDYALENYSRAYKRVQYIINTVNQAY